MGLSNTHIELVRAIANWVKENCSADESAKLLIDLPETPATSKPPVVGGFIPDAYIKHTKPILGEAKTSLDIETQHSREQYTAYLKHLKMFENSILVMAVPWHCIPQTRSLIAKIQKTYDAVQVKIIFIDKLPG